MPGAAKQPGIVPAAGGDRAGGVVADAAALDPAPARPHLDRDQVGVSRPGSGVSTPRSESRGSSGPRPETVTQSSASSGESVGNWRAQRWH